MTAFTTSEDGGIRRPLTIDGYDLDIPVGSLNVDATPISDSVDTIDGGSVTFQPSMPGGANLVDRYSVSFPVELVEGPSRRALERIRARGGYHLLCWWKPIFAMYAVTDASLALLLPQYRQNAAQVFAGLIQRGVVVGTDTFPFLVWKNGTSQVVDYSGGAPSSGHVLVGSGPYTTGQTTGYVPFTVGGLVAGDVVEIEFFPAFLMVLSAPKIAYPESYAESFSYVFRER